jgi:hypothetical protein
LGLTRLPEHNAASKEFDPGGFENFANILAVQILSHATAGLEQNDGRGADAQAGRQDLLRPPEQLTRVFGLSWRNRHFATFLNLTPRAR